ncbi:MAG: M28 family peptidase [Eubacteriales bacterium]|nr:M28 family peptidase [Eubacteriales bacterium]
MKKALTMLMLLVLAFAAAGCAKAEPMEPDMNQILTDLDTLAAQTRPVGSQGEQAAADYIRGRLTEMGYQVTTQPYEDGAGKAGSNVIAVKPARTENADILVISAHHDSDPSSYGANDNASGVTAMLAVADLVKDIKTDTELRFISFTAEETGRQGSRLYTGSLTEEELARTVGCIQLDMLGGLGSKGVTAATMDGQANWLSDLLTAQGLELTAETASDHASFQLAGIPSVLLTQKGRGYLYHTAADRADQLNLDPIAQAARLTAQTVQTVAASGSRQDRIDRNPVYRQTRQTVIYFDESVEDTENRIGAAGEAADHWQVEGDGWVDTYDSFRYSMLWFGGQTPVNTYYIYRNGYLQTIELRPAETGIPLPELRQQLIAMYGQPTDAGTDWQEKPYEAWQDEIYSKYITLTGTEEDFTVTVGKYAPGISNQLAQYPVTDGQADIADPEDAGVWKLLCDILPQQYRKKIVSFQLFTDGAGSILAYTAPVQEGDVTDNSRFVLAVDYYDVYDEQGNTRDLSRLTYTLLHEYAHVLLEDNTQIDLSRCKTTHDPAGFLEGSLRKDFYDRFWSELGETAVGDYEKDPTCYVSRYGANYFHEDIADTFAMFVLGGKPEGTTVAEQKLLLFWEYPKMVELRAAVRENLGLSLK